MADEIALPNQAAEEGAVEGDRVGRAEFLAAETPDAVLVPDTRVPTAELNRARRATLHTGAAPTAPVLFHPWSDGEETACCSDERGWHPRGKVGPRTLEVSSPEFAERITEKLDLLHGARSNAPVCRFLNGRDGEGIDTQQHRLDKVEVRGMRTREEETERTGLAV